MNFCEPPGQDIGYQEYVGHPNRNTFIAGRRCFRKTKNDPDKHKNKADTKQMDMRDPRQRPKSSAAIFDG